MQFANGSTAYLPESSADPRGLLNEDPAVTAARERKAAQVAAEKRKNEARAAAIASEKETELRRADCIRRGPPKIGMTPAEAIESCWRAPKRIVKKTTANGMTEDYVYSIGHILRFENGKLAEIIETQ